MPPFPVRRASVRVTIILWSVAVLTVSLFVFGSILRWQTERDILASVDNDLTHFARSDRHPPRDHHPFNGGPEDKQDKQGPDGHGPDERGPEPGPPQDGQREQPPYDRDGGPPPPQGDHASPADGAGRMQPVWRREWASDGSVRSFPQHGPPDNSGYTVGLPWDKKAFQAAKQQKRDVFSTVVLENAGPVRVYTFPVPGSDDRLPGIAQMARPLADLELALARLTSTLLTLIPPFLLFAGVSGAFLTSRVMQPVRDMARAASEIEAENLTGRLPVSGGDEFASLAQTFNAMLGRLHDAFERQKRFTADASHELRTPLAVIRAHTSLVLQSQTERTPEQYRKTFQTIDKAAQTATRLVQDLLLLARADTDRLEMHRETVRFADLLIDAVGAAEIAASVGGYVTAPVEIDLPDPALTVWGDGHYLLRLVTNLVENAVRYTPSTGQVRVEARLEGNHVLLTVNDTGEGIAPEHLPHVTERFYRVDDSRARNSGGSGLGLALCKNIVQAHGGTLRMESRVGQGTTVFVSLPTSSATDKRTAF